MSSEIKPGDEVICIRWAGTFFTIGKVYIVQKNGNLITNSGFLSGMNIELKDFKRYFIKATKLHKALL
jgi:hypothetical protein